MLPMHFYTGSIVRGKKSDMAALTSLSERVNGSEDQEAEYNTFPMDCRLVRSWTNEYYLCVPLAYQPGSMVNTGNTMHVDVSSIDEQGVENQDPVSSSKKDSHVKHPLRVCSLDPGVRTFNTVYDVNNGRATEIGKGDIGRIFRQCYWLDGMISAMGAPGVMKSKQRCNWRRAARRMGDKIRTLVGEVHRQAAKWLATSFDVIMLPTFNVSGMVKKADRVLTKNSVRKMMDWSHFLFRRRLLSKCRQTGAKVVLVSEAYTTKTCSVCGKMKKMGGAKMYHCGHCGASMDRDVNGAKNVFLRNYEALGIVVEQAPFPSHQHWGLPPSHP